MRKYDKPIKPKRFGACWRAVLEK
ncbi:hypothetical protein [Archaeoglobus veneficus]